MRLGMLADVRGMLAPLRTALDILRAEGCDRIVCLGSTAEGGADDVTVLATLADAGAVVVPSPHDVPPDVLALPAEAHEAWLTLAHALPEDMPAHESLWLTGYGVPWLLQVTECFRGAPGQRVCGDLYAPLLYVVPASGTPRRRVFVAPETLSVPDGSFLACPGSVATATAGTRGGSVMLWDDTTRALTVLTFDDAGRMAAPSPRLRILVYCAEFDDHRPDDAYLHDVDLQVRADAEAIVADVDALRPDLVLLDYHLDGKMTGLDALIALRSGRPQLPAPVFTIAGNPADNQGMKSAGATGSLPFTYLKDTLTRLICEVTGAA